MTPESGRHDTGPLRRKRPKDRTERILAAAAQLFRERGYHAIGIDEIGEAVGITGPAVYRHFESKEALLLTAAERAAERVNKALRDALADVESPDDELAALVRAGVSATIDDRDLSAVYVRESRHLESPSAMREIHLANAEMHLEALLRRRPELTRRQAGFILQAIVGLASSVLYSPYSPFQLARARLEDLLTRMGVAALLAAPVPDVRAFSRPVEADGSASTPHVPGDRPGDEDHRPRVRRASRREVILSAAIRLFNERGYQGVGMDDIGLAADITGPGIYRHFGGKEDILAAAFNRANEQLAASVSTSLTAAATAREAIERLIAAYVDITLSHADLIAVYLTESYALSPERQAAIRRDQRAYTDEWVALLIEDRPALSEAEARAMVGGAIGVVSGYAWGDLPLPVAAARPVLVTMATAALFDA